MDYIKHSSLQSSIQFNFIQSENRKQMIKFLLSFSVFSILVSYSSSISLHVKLFSYTFDKNYMFLLCNGLLVVIVKNSGLIGTSPPGSTYLTNDDHAVKSVQNHSKTISVVELAEKAEEEVIHVEIEHDQDEIFDTLEEDDDEGYRSSLAMVEYEDHEEIGLLSTEELNKKCDDFIRRMKEGIKLEVQQSMIMYR